LPRQLVPADIGASGIFARWFALRWEILAVAASGRDDETSERRNRQRLRGEPPSAMSRQPTSA